MRDYDPATAKYGESDPIGLSGGINSYAYVEGNTISRVDPMGMTWGDNWSMFWSWVFGNAAPNTIYGPSTNQSIDMMQSQGVQSAISYFNNKNAGKCPRDFAPLTNYGYKFGLKGLWQAGTNSTQQYVGSYNVDIYPEANGAIDVVVHNTTSLRSFLYGIYPDAWNLANGYPFGNTKQEYLGVLPPTSTGCGCSGH